jgi:hypothetical protein
MEPKNPICPLCNKPVELYIGGKAPAKAKNPRKEGSKAKKERLERAMCQPGRDYIEYPIGVGTSQKRHTTCVLKDENRADCVSILRGALIKVRDAAQKHITACETIERACLDGVKNTSKELDIAGEMYKESKHFLEHAEYMAQQVAEFAHMICCQNCLELLPEDINERVFTTKHTICKKCHEKTGDEYTDVKFEVVE